MLKKLFTSVVIGSLFLAGAASAADYKVDIEGQHAFVQFKVNHLGFSWMYGTFKDFDGTFSYDAAKPEDSKVNIVIKTNSVDTNHAERDKHLRGPDFLNTRKHPEATFASKSVQVTGEGTMDVSGDLTFNGVTKPVVIKVTKTGEGQDPWGGYRTGFEGSMSIQLKDFNVKMDLGPATQTVEFMLSLEGVRL
ncbi:YceI family protein [Aliidiomarina quisquiliarum]|uniref:YceI family protein n=1 Tax=Aliidiomarina quisquiliarum TaxID=2938947 RepID=UPI00208E3AC6|nr:YceI family protein [Aliidiomarina quisquiliarum]MCO4322571.1 YceI family protein [Aliidiomarina quisquiliarum]